MPVRTSCPVCNLGIYEGYNFGVVLPAIVFRNSMYTAMLSGNLGQNVAIRDQLAGSQPCAVQLIINNIFGSREYQGER